jgi:hypothetical protein
MHNVSCPLVLKLFEFELVLYFCSFIKCCAKMNLSCLFINVKAKCPAIILCFCFVYSPTNCTSRWNIVLIRVWAISPLWLRTKVSQNQARQNILTALFINQYMCLEVHVFMLMLALYLYYLWPLEFQSRLKETAFEMFYSSTY